MLVNPKLMVNLSQEQPKVAIPSYFLFDMVGTTLLTLLPVF